MKHAFIRLGLIALAIAFCLIATKKCSAQAPLQYKSAYTGQYVKKDVAVKSPATHFTVKKKVVKLQYSEDRELFLQDETDFTYHSRPGVLIIDTRLTQEQLWVLACEYQAWRIKNKKKREGI